MPGIFLKPTVLHASKLEKYLQDIFKKGAAVPVIHDYMYWRQVAFHDYIKSSSDKHDAEHTLGVAFKAADTLHGALVAQFLPNQPLFQAVGGPEFQPFVEQVNGVLDAQSKWGKWRTQLSRSLLDGVVQDLYGAIVDFKTEAKVEVALAPGGQLGTANASGIADSVTTTSSTLGYTTIERLNLFHCLWDTTVPPEELHSKGDFFAHSKATSFNELAKFLNTLGDEGYHPNLMAQLIDPESDLYKVTGISTLEGSLLGQSDANPLAVGYYRYSECGHDIQVDPHDGKLKSGTLTASEQAGAGFGTLPTVAPQFSKSLRKDQQAKMKFYNMEEVEAIAIQARTYVHTVIYFRAIPELLGIKNRSIIALPYTPMIFRVDLLNGKIVMALRILQDLHNWIPVGFAKLMDDGNPYSLHSYQERAEKFQKIGSKLVALELAAMNRVIQDRAIVDPELIDPVATMKAKGSGKILLRRQTGLAPRDITRAYHAIPFNNNGQGSMLQAAMAVSSMGNDLLGQNPVGQGQFIPGNKTNDQFAATLQGASARAYPIKVTCEDNFFYPIKFMLKANLIQYRNVANITRYVGGQPIELPQEAVSPALFELQIGDGLESPERLARQAEFAGMVTQWVQAGAGNQIDIPGALAFLGTNGYAKDFNKFRLPAPAAGVQGGGPPAAPGDAPQGPPAAAA